MNWLGAEARKLRTPPLVLGLLAAMLLSLVFITVFLASAGRNIRNAESEIDILAAGPTDEVCRYVEDGSGRPCEALLRERGRWADEWLIQLRHSYVLRAPIADPMGSGGIAAGFASSLPGALTMALVAAGHVAGEWGLGMAGVRFSRDPRGWRFVFGKFLTILLAGAVLLLLTWLAVAIIGPLLVSSGLSAGAPPFDSRGYLLQQLPRALLVLALYSALGTALGVGARRPLMTFLLMLATLGLSSLLAFTAGQWSPAAWVTSLMGFEPQGMLADHVWVDQDIHLVPRPAAMVGVLLLSVALLLVARLQVRRSPIDR